MRCWISERRMKWYQWLRKFLLWRNRKIYFIFHLKLTDLTNGSKLQTDNWQSKWQFFSAANMIFGLPIFPKCSIGYINEHYENRLKFTLKLPKRCLKLWTKCFYIVLLYFIELKLVDTRVVPALDVRFYQTGLEVRYFIIAKIWLVAICETMP